MSSRYSPSYGLRPALSLSVASGHAGARSSNELTDAFRAPGKSAPIAHHHEHAVRQRERDAQPPVARRGVIHESLRTQPLLVRRGVVENVAMVEAVVDDH